jgi:hypothetical protein
LISYDLVSEIEFTKKEFEILLQSKSVFCHQIISQMLVISGDSRFHNFAFLQSNYKLESSPDLLHFLIDLQIANQTEQDSITDMWMENRNKEKNKKKKNKLAKENSLKFEVDILTLPFAFDFSIGSKDSLMFMLNYSESKSNELVTSEWQKLIFYKWQKIKFFWFLVTFFYFVFLFFSIMVIVFKENNPSYHIMLYVLISFFLFFELLQFFSFLRFKWKKYVFNLSNFFDWIIFSLTLIFPLTITMHKDISEDFSKILGVITLTLAFYRGFSYLRIFDYFSSFIGIIREVISIHYF